MTSLEVLSWARKGIEAEQEHYREVRAKAIEDGALTITRYCQEAIDNLDAKMESLDEFEVLLSRK